VFRKLMMVCWALFAVSAATGLVGWAGYEYYGYQARASVADWEVPPAYAEDQEPDENVVQLQPAPLPDWDFVEKQIAFWTVGLISGWVAAGILLWNLILYTGHWIWMGRKAGKG
jgi:hypothetical protein